MKKLIALILMLIIAFSSVACGPKKSGDKAGKDKTSPLAQRDKDIQDAAGE